MSKRVTMTELIGRINRVLAKDGAELQRIEGRDRRRRDGAGYRVVTRSVLVSSHEDPIALGRELKVLGAAESVAR